MSEHKYTPGPWVYDSGCFYAQCQLDENGMTYESPIAELLEGRPEDSKGNAQLIAAAPELLAALEVAVEYFDRNDIDCIAHDDAKEAIKKAKGE